MRWRSAAITITAVTAAMTAGAAARQVAVPPAHTPVVTGAAPPAMPEAPAETSTPAGTPAFAGTPGTPALGSAPAGTTAKLVFALPAAWVAEQPGSAMRLAQARIPGPAGAAELAIFPFAGGGGPAEANIERWIGQIDQPAAPPRRGSFSTHGLAISWVEVAGTMKASTVGMGPATARPGSRLLGAVVEGPGGPWFVKATGPEKTIEKHSGEIRDFASSVKAK